MTSSASQDHIDNSLTLSPVFSDSLTSAPGSDGCMWHYLDLTTPELPGPRNMSDISVEEWQDAVPSDDLSWAVDEDAPKTSSTALTASSFDYGALSGWPCVSKVEDPNIASVGDSSDADPPCAGLDCNVWTSFLGEPAVPYLPAYSDDDMASFIATAPVCQAAEQWLPAHASHDQLYQHRHNLTNISAAPSQTFHQGMDMRGLEDSITPLNDMARGREGRFRPSYMAEITGPGYDLNIDPHTGRTYADPCLGTIGMQPAAATVHPFRPCTIDGRLLPSHGSMPSSSPAMPMHLEHTVDLGPPMSFSPTASPLAPPRHSMWQPMALHPMSELSSPPLAAMLPSGSLHDRTPTRAQLLDQSGVREHEYYRLGPQADGMYHCPIRNCSHKPTKLKCNYDKYIDSHIKPFRCRHDRAACANQHFSSTACLLRHEREAHGMHGHGDRPNLCHFEGCERAQPGRGFPRHYNLLDHMRRVQGWRDEARPPGSSSGGGGAGGAKGKKREREE